MSVPTKQEMLDNVEIAINCAASSQVPAGQQRMLDLRIRHEQNKNIF